jgi:SAM-dependent methyltransferase
MTLHDALAKLSDEEWLQLQLEGAASIEGYALPMLPPFGLQRRFNGGPDVESNIRSGLRHYRLARDRCRQLGRPLTEGSRVLDFGCGWGRILRFFLRDVSPGGLFGVDISVLGIETARSTDPHCTYLMVDPGGSLPFEDATFDLVYAMSVFSHLPEDLHLSRLEEMVRVLKHGGILVATTLSPRVLRLAETFREGGGYGAAWQRALANSFDEAAAAESRAGRFVFGAKPRPDYGMSIIPRKYVESVWGKALRIHEFTDDAGVLEQALIVAERP